MPTRRIANPIAKEIGARIRDLRQKKGKTLCAMAEACDVSTGHLSSIERGYVLMNVVTLWRIARGLGVRMEDFVAGLDHVQT